MKPVRAARLAAVTPRGVSLDCGDGITCRISVLLDDLVRVLFVRGTLREPRSWMVPAHGAADVPWEGRARLDDSAWPAAHHTFAEHDGTLEIATAALTLRVVLAPFALHWGQPGGPEFARDRTAHAYAFGRNGEWQHASARHPADRCHGLGDKTGPLDLSGRRLRTAMKDSLGYDPARGDPLYRHWPFLIVRDGASGVAHGIFYDTGAEATFDLGCEHDNYYGPYRSAAAGGDLDYYLFSGPKVADVTRRFLDLTGRPALPPRWSLGFAQTAMAIADADDAEAQMDAFIARCRDEEIPISSFHLGSGYTTIGPRRYVFTWNRHKYPDPEGLMRRFHAAGMHVVANLKPCLLDDHPDFATPATKGAFVRTAGGGPSISQFWDGEGAHLDFTNPEAVAWWQEGLRGQVLAVGIDTAWNDNNEYGFRDDDAFCHGFGHPLPLELARPLQPLLMTRASVEEQRRRAPADRAFSVSRAGCPGIQRYAQGWSGDNTTSWECLRWNLRTGLQMGLSGLGNTGHDVGGFAGPVPGPELLIRWTQAGVLHPRFIMNSWKPGGVYTTPWLHPEAVAAIRDALRLRYRLIPYLYSLMHALSANLDGAAPLRPTFVQFPDDPRCLADTDALMLGPFLFAAPVVAPGLRSRAAYLPAGVECWFTFDGRERLPAGAEAMLAAPLDRLPLVVAAGAILPLTDTDDYARRHDEPSRQVRLFPGPGQGESRFVLVEDDGVSASGPVTRLTFALSWTAEQVVLTADRAGDYALPYESMRLVLPASERRPLRLRAGGGMPRLIV